MFYVTCPNEMCSGEMGSSEMCSNEVSYYYEVLHYYEVLSCYEVLYFYEVMLPTSAKQSYKRRVYHAARHTRKLSTFTCYHIAINPSWGGDLLLFYPS